MDITLTGMVSEELRLSPGQFSRLFMQSLILSRLSTISSGEYFLLLNVSRPDSCRSGQDFWKSKTEVAYMPVPFLIYPFETLINAIIGVMCTGRIIQLG